MEKQHIVKSYDLDLFKLKSMIGEMGGHVLHQLQEALACVHSLDQVAATKVIENDPVIDRYEREIDAFSVKILALRHPLARDLRTVVSALKISSDLERIADYAANMAKRTKLIETPLPKSSLNLTSKMVEEVQKMIKGALKAYQHDSVEKAMEVWYQDNEIDEMYVSLLRELLTYMMENPKNIGSCTQLLFIAKNIERMGDHVTNISEMVYYQVEGEPFTPAKDKS